MRLAWEPPGPSHPRPSTAMYIEIPIPLVSAAAGCVKRQATGALLTSAFPRPPLARFMCMQHDGRPAVRGPSDSSSLASLPHDAQAPQVPSDESSAFLSQTAATRSQWLRRLAEADLSSTSQQLLYSPFPSELFASHYSATRVSGVTMEHSSAGTGSGFAFPRRGTLDAAMASRLGGVSSASAGTKASTLGHPTRQPTGRCAATLWLENQTSSVLALHLTQAGVPVPWRHASRRSHERQPLRRHGLVVVSRPDHPALVAAVQAKTQRRARAIQARLFKATPLPSSSASVPTSLAGGASSWSGGAAFQSANASVAAPVAKLAEHSLGAESLAESELMTPRHDAGSLATTPQLLRIGHLDGDDEDSGKADAGTRTDAQPDGQLPAKAAQQPQSSRLSRVTTAPPPQAAIPATALPASCTLPPPPLPSSTLEQPLEPAPEVQLCIDVLPIGAPAQPPSAPSTEAELSHDQPAVHVRLKVEPEAATTPHAGSASPEQEQRISVELTVLEPHGGQEPAQAWDGDTSPGDPPVVELILTASDGDGDAQQALGSEAAPAAVVRVQLRCVDPSESAPAAPPPGAGTRAGVATRCHADQPAVALALHVHAAGAPSLASDLEQRQPQPAAPGARERVKLTIGVAQPQSPQASPEVSPDASLSLEEASPQLGQQRPSHTAASGPVSSSAASRVVSVQLVVAGRGHELQPQDPSAPAEEQQQQAQPLPQPEEQQMHLVEPSGDGASACARSPLLQQVEEIQEATEPLGGDESRRASDTAAVSVDPEGAQQPAAEAEQQAGALPADEALRSTLCTPLRSTAAAAASAAARTASHTAAAAAAATATKRRPRAAAAAAAARTGLAAALHQRWREYISPHAPSSAAVPLLTASKSEAALSQAEASVQQQASSQSVGSGGAARPQGKALDSLLTALGPALQREIAWQLRQQFHDPSSPDERTRLPGETPSRSASPSPQRSGVAALVCREDSSSPLLGGGGSEPDWAAGRRGLPAWMAPQGGQREGRAVRLPPLPPEHGLRAVQEGHGEEDAWGEALDGGQRAGRAAALPAQRGQVHVPACMPLHLLPIPFTSFRARQRVEQHMLAKPLLPRCVGRSVCVQGKDRTRRGVRSPRALTGRVPAGCSTWLLRPSCSPTSLAPGPAPRAHRATGHSLPPTPPTTPSARLSSPGPRGRSKTSWGPPQRTTRRRAPSRSPTGAWPHT